MNDFIIYKCNNSKDHNFIIEHYINKGYKYSIMKCENEELIKLIDGPITYSLINIYTIDKIIDYYIITTQNEKGKMFDFPIIEAKDFIRQIKLNKIKK